VSSEAGSNQARGALGPLRPDRCAPTHSGAMRPNARATARLGPCGRGRGCTQGRGHQRQSEVIRGARHGARLWKRTGMHPRTRSSEAIRGHQRRSPWRSPVEEDGDAPKDEGVDDGLSRDGVTCGERGGGRREEHVHANGHLEAASPGGCRQNVAFQYSREIECHDGSRACGERGAMMSTCMHLHAVARSSALARIPRPSSPSRCPARSPCRRGDGIYRWARTPGRTPSARPAGGRPPRDRRAAPQMPRRRAAGGRARSAMGILVRSARGARRSGGVPDEGRTQDQSEAIRGNQWQSEAIRGNQRQSEAIRSNQKQSEAIRGNQRQSVAIRGNQRQSEAIRGNQKQSEAIRSNQKQSGSSGGVPDEGGTQMPSRYHQQANRSTQMVRTPLGWATEWYRASGL